jgi:hypothetical protein
VGAAAGRKLAVLALIGFLNQFIFTTQEVSLPTPNPRCPGCPQRNPEEIMLFVIEETTDFRVASCGANQFPGGSFTR